MAGSCFETSQGTNGNRGTYTCSHPPLIQPHNRPSVRVRHAGRSLARRSVARARRVPRTGYPARAWPTHSASCPLSPVGGKRAACYTPSPGPRALRPCPCHHRAGTGSPTLSLPAARLGDRTRAGIAAAAAHRDAAPGDAPSHGVTVATAGARSRARCHSLRLCRPSPIRIRRCAVRHRRTFRPWSARRKPAPALAGHCS